MNPKRVLLRAGFFRELEHDIPTSTDPSIEEVGGEAIRRHRARVVAYLEQGTVLAVAAGPTSDYFQRPGRHIIGSLCLQTDGVWLWPSDLSYYVQYYGVAVPDAFLAHMEAGDWRPSALTREELRQLALRPRG